jgi:hypothetical protein
VKLFHKHEWSKWVKYEKAINVFGMDQQFHKAYRMHQHRHCLACGYEQDEVISQ